MGVQSGRNAVPFDPWPPMVGVVVLARRSPLHPTPTAAVS
ncbi:MAG: hypothetical protein JWR11_947 [Mycobacterium sp.]|jgi:hypothetical protein|nr:hypothetical protein [Mycobacterium sp.]MDT5179300.1 hypothetical protein [Mycobacterium sp.]